MNQFMTNKPVPLELLPALLDAYRCVQYGYPSHAIRLPEHTKPPQEAFRDEDGWYVTALDLFTIYELQLPNSKD